MQNFTRLFGIEFKNLRQEKNCSQWEIALKIPYHIRNIQRIEKGVTQPGIRLSFKLLQTLDILPGDFLTQLWVKYRDELPSSISPISQVKISYALLSAPDLPKSLFGPFLHQARMVACISQTAMAKAASYNLRNINAVEKGMQEPGIMTALGLVLTTGVDVREFFNRLFFYWQEINEKHNHDK